MNFKEAMQEMKNGKKVTKRSWGYTQYLKMCGDMIKSFGQEVVPYQYNSSILTSKDWCELNNDDSLEFVEVIEKLKQGKKVKLNSWDNETYLMIDENRKDLMLVRSVEQHYSPSFECLASNDWEIKNEFC